MYFGKTENYSSFFTAQKIRMEIVTFLMNRKE